MMSEIISVIIPVKNRQHVIERAINSVLSQNINLDIEVIVVDDASTDNTIGIVKALAFKNSKIQLIKNKESVGGAVARNIGAKQAQGEYIAFLDSDDEWLEQHLKTKINLIVSQNVDGVFGAFFTSNTKKVKQMNFPKYENVSLATYIFEKGGDARTSTFVFRRDAFMNVMFDDKLGKHQDWDIAIRFAQKFKFAFDYNYNVIMYVDGFNRMSNKNNYEASSYFLKKHKNIIANQALFNFKMNICFNAYRTEGNSQNYKVLMGELKELLEVNKDVKPNRKYKLLRNLLTRRLLPLIFLLKRLA